MAEQFRLMANELRKVSGDLGDVSSRMNEVMSSLRAQLAGEGTPWGKYGNGPNGVQAQIDHVETSVESLATNGIDHLAKFLRRFADIFETSDES